VKRWRVGLLGLVVSLVAIYFIASQVNLNQLKDAIVGARYIYVLPTVVFLLLGLVTRAFRWQVLLSGDLPIGRTFSIMNVAYLVNGVLPLRNSLPRDSGLRSMRLSNCSTLMPAIAPLRLMRFAVPFSPRVSS